jgi:hypothetical protein
MSANLKIREEVMKSLLAFRLAIRILGVGSFGIAALLSTSTPAAAQSRGSGNALGLRGMTNPLGGIANVGPGFGNPGLRSPAFPTPGFNSNRNFNGGRRRQSGFPYAYSVWVPDYFDYQDAGPGYGAGYGYGAAPYGAPQPPSTIYYDPALGGAPGSQQPIIINQYFSGPAPGQTAATAPAQTSNGPAANITGTPNRTTNTGAAGPGDPIGSPQNYYLIAYKNHEIYAVLAYWVEDRTLHYVTTQNTHNQASIDLIDIPFTKSLNQDRQVPFSIAAQ